MEILKESSDSQLEDIIRDFKWDGRGHFRYGGQFMMQSPLVLPMFARFFKQEEFKNVIEIGTANGGLAVFLQEQAKLHNFNFFTYDILEPTNKSQQFLSVKNAILRDVFDPISTKEIKKTIASGRTLILCDGGAKAKEVNTFAPMLKEGDFIMAHDYGRDIEYHEKKIKQYWRWCEITDSNIAEILPTIERYDRIDFEKAAWLCAVKNRAPSTSTTSVNYGGLGGWALGINTFNYLVNNFGNNSMTILELGSGTGTRELSKFFTMYSIEHDPQWLTYPPEITTYIHAPLVDGWYCVDTLRQNFVDKKYDILLIDGPPQGDRPNIEKHIDMFDSSVIWVFDDSERPQISALAHAHRRRVDGEAIEIHEAGGKKSTIIIPNSKNIKSPSTSYDLATIKKWDIDCVKHVKNLVDKVYMAVKGKNTIKVIDIGANSGKFLELLDEKIEVTDALLVEPDKSLLDFCEDKFKSRDFTYLNRALYEKTCKMFWSAASPEEGNLGVSRVVGHANEHAIEVIAFDELGFTIFEPDLIKIDAEGCDFKIILGMLNFLKSLKNKPLIVAETNGYGGISPESAVDLIKIQNVLENMGYTFDTVPEYSTDLFFRPNVQEVDKC